VIKRVLTLVPEAEGVVVSGVFESARRDVVYGEHKNLVDDFKARVRAQHAMPNSIARIADENRALKNENDALKKQLAE